MDFKYALLISIGLSATGCRVVLPEGGQQGGLVCNSMASVPTLRLKISSTTPLPEPLAFSVNGPTRTVAECEIEDNHALRPKIQPNADRTQIQIEVFQYGPALEFEPYGNLYDPKQEPRSKTVILRVQALDSCASDQVQQEEIIQAEIEWTPIEAGGKGCGITSYDGKAELSL